MVMIGGLGTLVGASIGGAFFIVLQEKVSSYVQWYSIVVGLVPVFIVLFVPKGLLGFRSALRLYGVGRGSPAAGTGACCRWRGSRTASPPWPPSPPSASR